MRQSLRDMETFCGLGRFLVYHLQPESP